MSVLTSARVESERLGHRFIGTEHLLLGVLTEHGGIAFEVLREWNVRIDAARSEVRALAPLQSARHVYGDSTNPDDRSLTPRARRILGEWASYAAYSFGDSEIDPEHILLGLIDEGQGLGARALTRLSGGLEGISRQVKARLTNRQLAGSAPSLDPTMTRQTEAAAEVVATCRRAFSSDEIEDIVRSVEGGQNIRRWLEQSVVARPLHLAKLDIDEVTIVAPRVAMVDLSSTRPESTVIRQYCALVVYREPVWLISQQSYIQITRERWPDNIRDDAHLAYNAGPMQVGAADMDVRDASADEERRIRRFTEQCARATPTELAELRRRAPELLFGLRVVDNYPQ